MVIQQHIHNHLKLTNFKAGSLIITLFGDAILPRHGEIWLGSLITLLTPFRLNERQIRTAIFRLTKAHWLSAQSHGRRANYKLTGASMQRFKHAAQQIYMGAMPLWDQQWRIIISVGPLTMKQKQQLRIALLWQGFGLLQHDCYIHPNADLSRTLDSLGAEGLHFIIPKLLPLMAVNAQLPYSIDNSAIALTTWDLNQIARFYQKFIATYTPILDALSNTAASLPMSDEAAFILRILLIHDYRRMLLRDPTLPAPLLPPHWPGHNAWLLCKTLYLRLLASSEHYLDQHMCLANGQTPKASSLLAKRFKTPTPSS